MHPQRPKVGTPCKMPLVRSSAWAINFQKAGVYWKKAVRMSVKYWFLHVSAGISNISKHRPYVPGSNVGDLLIAAASVVEDVRLLLQRL